MLLNMNAVSFLKCTVARRRRWRAGIKETARQNTQYIRRSGPNQLVRRALFSNKTDSKAAFSAKSTCSLCPGFVGSL